LLILTFYVKCIHLQSRNNPEHISIEMTCVEYNADVYVAVEELLGEAGVACDQIHYEDFAKMVAFLTVDAEQTSDQQ